MSINDLEFHSQFEREYFYFLERRKREQEAELQIITDRKKLKETARQVEKCFEISLTGDSRNKDILSEISDLSELKTVSNILLSGVFHADQSSVSEKPIKYSRPCMVCSDLHRDVEHGSCQGEHSGTMWDCDTPLSSGISGPSFGNLCYTENQPAESIYKWPLVYPNDEVDDLAKEEKVSNLITNFGNHLIAVLTSTKQFAKKVLKIDPPEKGLSDRELGSCYVSIGAAEIERNHLDKSRTAYREALRIGIDTDDIVLQCKALTGLGTLADILNDVESATNSYTTALDLLYHQLSTVEVLQLQEVIEEKLNSTLRTETF